jgi:hypothetical protein
MEGIKESGLPNFKFRSRTRTPEDLRTVCSRLGMRTLEQKLEGLGKEVEKNRKSLQVSVNRPSTADRWMKSPKKGKERRINMNSPLMKFKNCEMSDEMYVMTKFRDTLVSSFEKNNLTLTVDKLDELRQTSVQKDLTLIQGIRKKQQAAKLQKELRSRNEMSNAIYLILAMPKKKRKTLGKELSYTIPNGTRFHITT